MNKLLTSFLNLIKSWDRGDLALYPDPAPPADLGTPLTQSEIDFVKKLKKEMDERFDDSICSSEKVGAAITNTFYQLFTAGWNDPSGSIGSTVNYREQGSVVWLAPNTPGNATGAYNGVESYSFTSGLVAGTTYEIRIQNICPSGIPSAGVIVSAIATTF